MLFLIVVLPASFGELVNISPEDHPDQVRPFWEGKNALKIENGVIHTAFVYFNGYPEVAYQQFDMETGEIALFPLEQFPFDNNSRYSLTGVVLEMTPDGNFIVIHPNSEFERELYCQLNRYVVNPQGEIINRDNRVFPDHFISQVISHYDDSYHIVLRKGSSHPTDHSYHIFSDTVERTDTVSWYRYLPGDVIYGRVHHNSDIWIQGSGGQ